MSTLADWLVDEQLVTPDQLVQAQHLQRESAVALTTALLELELVEEGVLVDLIARRNSLPKAPKRMHRITVPSKALTTIPQDYCWQHGLFPFGVDPSTRKLQIAIVDPADPEAVALVKKLVRQDFQLYVASPRQVEKAIRKHYLDSWIDESAASAPRRFFGYDNITNPGVSNKRPADPSREPSPAVGHAAADPSQTGPLGPPAVMDRPTGPHSPVAAVDRPKTGPLSPVAATVPGLGENPAHGSSGSAAPLTPDDYALLWGDAAASTQSRHGAQPHESIAATAERARSLTPPPQVPIAPTPTPPPAATAPRRATGTQQLAKVSHDQLGDLQLRVEALERALAELLAVLGAGSQDTAGRITKISAALRRALDKE